MTRNGSFSCRAMLDPILAPSMKPNSIRNRAIDEILHNVCKDSSKICKNRSSLSWESHERSNPNLIRSYPDVMLSLDNRDFLAQGGLDPAPGYLLTISDTSKVEDLGSLTEESKPVGFGETAREDALENAKISDGSTAVTHCFLNDSSYLEKFMLADEELGALNLQMAEFDSIFKSKVSGFASELVFSSTVKEDCFMLPSLEEVTGQPFDQASGLHGDFWLNLDRDVQFNVLNNHSDICNQAAVDFGLMDSEETDVIHPISFIKNFVNLSDLETNALPAMLSLETSRKRMTLVLDLDETLVHSTTRPCANADFCFRIPINKEEKTMYVRRRPFLKAFLERVSEMFEIILFTASQGSYAKLLLDHLDPEGKFFSRCAFRDSCVHADGIFTKDLTVLGVDLAKVAIVDNTPEVYRWQVNNGIPIKSWYDDPTDTELMNLLPFLETLVDVDDVRPIIEQEFGGKGQ